MLQDIAQVSVVIPLYNAEKYIELTLNSLVQQSYLPEKFEVIVVDDGSTDSSCSIVENYSAPFALRLIRQDNCGVSAARNAGAKNANGHIIAFLDNDATADRDWLKNAMDLFNQKELDAIEGRIEAQGGTNPPTPFTHILQNETGGRFMTCNMIFRKAVFEKVGGFDPRFPYFLEDSDLAFSLLEAGFHIFYAKNVLVYHPKINKPFRYHWWQMTGLAFRIPLLFAKHPKVIRNCKKYGIPWHTMTACPIYFYGYYAALALALFSSIAGALVTGSLGSLIFEIGMLLTVAGFIFSYLFTMYARLRRRVWLWSEVWPLLFAYLVIPYVRVFWLVRGALHFRVKYPFP